MCRGVSAIYAYGGAAAVREKAARGWHTDQVAMAKAATYVKGLAKDVGACASEGLQQDFASSISRMLRCCCIALPGEMR